MSGVIVPSMSVKWSFPSVVVAINADTAVRRCVQSGSQSCRAVAVGAGATVRAIPDHHGHLHRPQGVVANHRDRSNVDLEPLQEPLHRAVLRAVRIAS